MEECSTVVPGVDWVVRSGMLEMEDDVAEQIPMALVKADWVACCTISWSHGVRFAGCDGWTMTVVVVIE